MDSGRDHPPSRRSFTVDYPERHSLGRPSSRRRPSIRGRKICERDGQERFCDLCTRQPDRVNGNTTLRHSRRYDRGGKEGLANLETSTFVRRWSPSDISVLRSTRLRSFRLRSLRLVRETGQILHVRGDSQSGRDGGATL